MSAIDPEKKRTTDILGKEIKLKANKGQELLLKAEVDTLDMS